jgi:hypothetical protein
MRWFDEKIFICRLSCQRPPNISEIGLTGVWIKVLPLAATGSCPLAPEARGF